MLKRKPKWAVQKVLEGGAQVLTNTKPISKKIGINCVQIFVIMPRRGGLRTMYTEVAAAIRGNPEKFCARITQDLICSIDGVSYRDSSLHPPANDVEHATHIEKVQLVLEIMENFSGYEHMLFSGGLWEFPIDFVHDCWNEYSTEYGVRRT